MPFKDDIVAGDYLIRPAIKSPNYDQGVTGWAINSDGSAEFNNISVNGGQVIINDPNGDTVASIDNSGVASFQDLSSVLSPNFYGLDLQTQIIDPLPRGLVSTGTSTTLSTSTSGTEVGTIEVSATLEANRSYMIEAQYLIQCGNNGNNLTTGVRYTTNGTSPTISSTLLFQDSIWYQTSGIDHSAKTNAIISGLTAGTYRFLLTGNRNFGTGVIALKASASIPARLTITDIGPTRTNTAVVNNGGGGGGGPVQQYTVAHLPLWSRAYNGSGTPGSFSQPNSIYQGYNQSDGNGNRKSMIGYDWATIQSQLSGATIQSCTISMYFAHWYNNSGGTAIIGYHNNASGTAPASFSSAGTITSSAGWPKPGLRTVDLGGFGTLLAAGTAKGITLGPGSTTGAVYYGYANGAGMSNPPTLTIIYTK